MFTAQDCQWMAQALKLAELGLYSTTPNPRVGCVLVVNGSIVGSGWHHRAGEAHAEINALSSAGEAARGATAYVTLEPCGHHGLTSPCVDALIAAGIMRVVVAVEDPNPQVAGAGCEKLRAAGIAVDVGLMQAEAQGLNAGFFSRMTRGIPWVRSKVGMSLDGRTALVNGESQWITGTASRLDVHHWRARSCAVLTGINTVIADDPMLTVRDIATERQPMRVVVDSRLRISATAQILQPGLGGKTLLYTIQDEGKKIAELEEADVSVCVLAEKNKQVDLRAMLHNLAQRGCNEVQVEAGSSLNGALLRAGLVDELLLYVAPQLLGDAARGVAKLGELTNLDQRINLKWQDVRQVGEDLRILARVDNV